MRLLLFLGERPELLVLVLLLGTGRKPRDKTAHRFLIILVRRVLFRGDELYKNRYFK